MSAGFQPNASEQKPSPPDEATEGILDEIRRVLAIEIEGLQCIHDRVGPEFARAVEAINGCDGKVVVTGVGKSGIIASKVAATLTSTGTAAVFLHPSEALHGDVGIVQSGDVVIASGKSGESTELIGLLTVLKTIDVTLIALTGVPGSTVGRMCDICVNLEVPREACVLNLAPTASSTAALAVGDAIAVALMKLKKFSVDEFARHHPGGQLGKRLTLTVSKVMRSGKFNPVVFRGDSIKVMLIRITEGQAGAVSVVDENGCLCGIVTDFDIRRVLEEEKSIFDFSISELMNSNPSAILQTEKAWDALNVMATREKRTSVLPIVDEGNRVVGILHLADLLAAGI